MATQVHTEVQGSLSDLQPGAFLRVYPAQTAFCAELALSIVSCWVVHTLTALACPHATGSHHLCDLTDTSPLISTLHCNDLPCRCILDSKPRTIDAEQCNLLCNLAELVVREMERESAFILRTVIGLRNAPGDRAKAR